jgi:hypothetical protein
VLSFLQVVNAINSDRFDSITITGKMDRLRELMILLPDWCVAKGVDPTEAVSIHESGGHGYDAFASFPRRGGGVIAHFAAK